MVNNHQRNFSAGAWTDRALEQGADDAAEILYVELMEQELKAEKLITAQLKIQLNEAKTQSNNTRSSNAGGASNIELKNLKQQVKQLENDKIKLEEADRKLKEKYFE